MQTISLVVEMILSNIEKESYKDSILLCVKEDQNKRQGIDILLQL
jgi:hypothetical protein